MSAAESLFSEIGNYPLAPKTRRFLTECTLGHFIDGEVVVSRSEETFPVYDPNTGRQFAQVAAGGAEDVDRAARAARRAFDDGRWRNVSPADKERVLRRFAALLEDNRDVLLDLDMLDGGVIRGYAPFFAQVGIDVTHYYAGWPTKLHGSMPASTSGLVVQEVREPVGVCGVITPWNGPSSAVMTLAPALACGNSVVWKPAEQTPLTALFAARLCMEAGVPPGVVNVIQGIGAIAGAALVEHPMVDTISFTGSVETGRRIQVAAAQRLKRVCMELGGKSPHIIFRDADLTAAAAAATAAVWGHQGQVCTAGTRVLVQREIHDELVAAMVSASRSLKIGSAFDAATQVGPMISQQQIERVSRYVAIGREEGAEVVLGGARHGNGGYFHQPTIFTGVRNDMRIAQEEIFGPVMAVIPFDTEEQAFAIGNDTDYGLAAGVWTRDLGRAHRASQRLRVGTVWVNCYQLVNPSVSYGGVKQSGYGRNLGTASIEDFTQIKSVWLSTTY